MEIMDILQTLVIVFHIVAALVIIGLVLLQHGKGADMGASFGGGSAGSLFGATGSANFLSRTTAVVATIFFLTSLGMAFIATHKPRTGGGVMEGVTLPSAPAIPAAPVAPSPAAIPGQAAAPASGAAAVSNEPAKINQIPK
ncbi:MAG: preprotein translocase, SecG subunit [Betaproteobacteria bacterium]|nr:preprotein translocase, SecG subunit [Betaproteobacteria bacterium]